MQLAIAQNILTLTGLSMLPQNVWEEKNPFLYPVLESETQLCDRLVCFAGLGAPVASTYWAA
jgi:hypothetical protein